VSVVPFTIKLILSMLISSQCFQIFSGCPTYSGRYAVGRACRSDVDWELLPSCAGITLSAPTIDLVSVSIAAAVLGMMRFDPSKWLMTSVICHTVASKSLPRPQFSKNIPLLGYYTYYICLSRSALRSMVKPALLSPLKLISVLKGYPAVSGDINILSVMGFV